MTAFGPPTRAISSPAAMSALRRSPWRKVLRFSTETFFFIVCSKKSVPRKTPLVDSIHFPVIAYVNSVYFIADTSLKGRCNMADGFIWYELVTNDMDKAVTFYKKVVGWDIKDSGMPGMKYMLFGKDGKDVGGMMSWAGAGEPELPTQWMGHIHTAKLDEELKAVTADGGTIVKPGQDIPGVGRFAFVLDPQ